MYRMFHKCVPFYVTCEDMKSQFIFSGKLPSARFCWKNLNAHKKKKKRKKKECFITHFRNVPYVSFWMHGTYQNGIPLLAKSEPVISSLLALLSDFWELWWKVFWTSVEGDECTTSHSPSLFIFWRLFTTCDNSIQTQSAAWSFTFRGAPEHVWSSCLSWWENVQKAKFDRQRPHLRVNPCEVHMWNKCD